ncbi:MAG: hypothetical protein AB7S57_21845 [Acetobacteraceae bacterium]
MRSALKIHLISFHVADCGLVSNPRACLPTGDGVHCFERPGVALFAPMIRRTSRPYSIIRNDRRKHMADVTPRELVSSIMGKMYDILANGDETVPKTEDNFFSWCSPGLPTAVEDFEFLQQGLTGVVKKRDIDQISSTTTQPGGQTTTTGVELTPALLDQLRAQDTARLYGQAENLARLVDLVVDVNKATNDQFARLAVLNNEGSLSEIYRYVLDMSQVMETELPADVKQKIEKFRGLLHVTKKKKNLIDDTETEVTEPSPLTTAYFDKMAAYEAAALEYNARRVDALTAADPRSVHYFALNGNVLRNRVRAAMMDWVSNGYKNDYEEIAAFIDQVMRRDMALLKEQYRQELEDARLTGLASGSDFFYTSLLPASFATSTGWTGFTFRSGDYSHYQSSNYNASKWKASAGASYLGIFGVAGTASKSQSRTEFNSNFNLDTFSLDFEIAQAVINRPWLKRGFLSSKTWRFNPANPDSRGDMLSDGAAPPHGLLPAYPTSVIFIRNLRLNMGHSEGFRNFMSQHANSSVGGGGAVHFGLFHLGGSYNRVTASGSSSQSNGYSWDNQGLSVPGMQVVGFKCHVMPKSPDPDSGITKWV